MDVFGKIKNSFSRTPKVVNDAGMGAMGREFLRFGNRRRMVDTSSIVQMGDEEFYTGYSYAAINNRANKVSQLALGNIRTTATPEIMAKAKKTDTQIVHPYIDILDKSDDFTNSAFWYDISSYLDLEGVYYLMAVRAIAGSVVGEIQYFKMLNPYEIRRVRNKETNEIGGYIETRDGLVREIPPEMIIEMRKFNPFSRDSTFAMTDAAKEYQFTIKQASDYTRSSLKNNITAPGIITTDVLLENEDFANFKNRIINQEKGTPLFGNGAGAIQWQAMQIDLDKAALNDINSINRDTLFAVSGVSKTTMGIEESGTTREVSRTQKDKFMEDHIMPQLQLILDALNQDYKKYYKVDYEKNKYTLIIDSPMAADKDAELKDVQIAQQSFDLYQEMLDNGYDAVIAEKFARGVITLADVGEPTNEPKPKPTPPGSTPPVDPTADKTLTEIQDTPDSKKKTPVSKKTRTKKKANHHKSIIDDQWLFNYEPIDECDEDCEICNDLVRPVNELGEVVTNNVNDREASLQNAVINTEGLLVSEILKNITKAKNDFESQDNVISESKKKNYEKELAIAMSAYYTILFPIYGNQLLRKRASQYGEFVSLNFDKNIHKLIETYSQNAARSHVNTVVDDILKVARQTYQMSLERELAKLTASGANPTEEIKAQARKNLLDTNLQQEIISAVTSTYQDITKTRAKAVARSEANRAFNLSQLESDRQFLNSTGMMNRAYKQLVTSGSACDFCRSLSSRPSIPFEDNFVDLGGEITTTTIKDDGTTVVRKLTANYQDIAAGDVHTNCDCRYELEIR